jgi:predicted HTH domain antitoxin
MSKRRPKKVVKTADMAPRLRKALAKRTKDELLDVLVELAEEDRDIFRRLAARMELEAPPQELASATRQAIADATDFDERDINRNFSYDYEAYGEVKRNLCRLIDLGELHLAMELSLELMKQGSCQVEMSDEGLMTQDIEKCLRVVLQALKECELPPDEVVAWCAGMINSDRVGCICDRDLGALRNDFEALRSQ